MIDFVLNADCSLGLILGADFVLIVDSSHKYLTSCMYI